MPNINTYLQDAEFRVNHGDTNHAPTRLGSHIVRRSLRVFKGVYNFAQGGGSTAANIPLCDPVFAQIPAGIVGGQQQLNLPASFIISKVIVDVVTAPVGSGASIAISSGQNAGDLLAATAITSLTVGLYDGIPTTAAITNIKIPSTQAQPGSSAYITVTGAALTAGLINVHIIGFLSD